MKNTVKKLGLLLAVLIMGAMFAISANALDTTGQCGDNVYWNFYSETGELVISGTGNTTDYDATVSPFWGNTYIKSVIVEDGVITIGSRMFMGCGNLEEVTISESVNFIGYGAFGGCGLTNVIIPNSVTSIGDGAFVLCGNLTNVTIPNSVTSIGDSAFALCVNLTNVTIPNSVTSIGDSAFALCVNLEEANIPDSVVFIGQMAFAFTKIKNVTIGEKTINVGKGAFGGCENLEKITVNEANKYYTSVDGVLFNKNKTTLIQYPLNKTGVTYTVPNGITKIEEIAFGGGELGNISCMCDLEEILLPSTLREIGADAFTACPNIKKIVIPEKVTTIKSSTFSYCKSLSNITLTKNIKNIEKYAFTDCEKLTDVYYNGTKAEWKSVAIDNTNESNAALLNAIIHCSDGDYKKEPPQTHTGILENFETSTVVIINGGDGYDYVSEITVDGVVYKIEDKNLISLDLVQELVGMSVTFKEMDGIVTEIISYDTSEDEEDIYVPIPYTGANIFCYDQYVESHQDILLDNWNTFKITGKINNFNLDHDLTDVYITIKSPDENIIKFNSSEKSEVTFPLGRIIDKNSSDDFKCKAYVNRHYMPAGGTETIRLVCILNGYIDGVKIEDCYSFFDVTIKNLAYKEPEIKWSKQSVEELLDQMYALVPSFESYYRIKKGYLSTSGLRNDINALKVTLSVAKMESGLTAAETVFDIAAYVSGVKTAGVKEYAMMFLDQLSVDSNDKVSEIIGTVEQRLINNPYFNDFIEWCCNEGYDFVMGYVDKYEVKCPTDVIVTDIYGDLVLSIVNNEVSVSEEYLSIYASVYEGEKIFYLPNDTEFNIEIIATDNGVMDYSVSAKTNYGEIKSFYLNDISIEKNKKYSVNITASQDKDISTYNIVNEDGTVVEFDKDHLCIQKVAIIKEPTCTQKGSMVEYCKICSSLLGEIEISTLGHNYQTTITNPTCTEAGSITYTCSCGDTYTETIPVTGHAFDGSECTNCDYDKADDCDCRCHADNFFVKIIWNIINFFNKLLRKNQLCDCGAEHY